MNRSKNGWTPVVVVVGLFLVAPAAPAWGDSYVYVGNLDGTVSQFARSQGNTAPSGALTPLSPATVNVPGFPYGIAVAEGQVQVDPAHPWVPPYVGTFLYATNGAVAGRVSQYEVGLGGLLSASMSAEAGTFPRGVAATWNRVFVATQGDNTASYYWLERWGTPFPRGEVAAGSSPAGVAVGPKTGYVTNRAGDTVSQYSLTQWSPGCDGGAGCPLQLSPMSPAAVATGDAPFGVVLHPDGSSVYVTNASSNSISQYSVDPSGALVPKAPATVPTGATPLGLAASPDGRSLYVAKQGSDSIAQYSVDPTTGTLAPKSPATVGTGGEPTAVAVSADGRSVYATNLDDGTVSQYDVAADGALTPMARAVAKAGTDPYAIAVTADMPRRLGRAIRVIRRRVAVNRRRVAAIPVRCPTRLDRCRVRVALRRVGSRRVIARGRVTVRGARTARARARLSRPAYAALRRRGRLRVRVSARAVHAARNRSRHSATITLTVRRTNEHR